MLLHTLPTLHYLSPTAGARKIMKSPLWIYLFVNLFPQHLNCLASDLDFCTCMSHDNSSPPLPVTENHGYRSRKILALARTVMQSVCHQSLIDGSFSSLPTSFLINTTSFLTKLSTSFPGSYAVCATNMKENKINGSCNIYYILFQPFTHLT